MLYNWYSVDDSRNIAPSGWQMPSKAEWQQLLDYFGGSNVASGKIKEVGYAHWSANTRVTSESGFSALPGGYRDSADDYGGFGDGTTILSATFTDNNGAWVWKLGYNSKSAFLHNNEIWGGFSVRCVKD